MISSHCVVENRKARKLPVMDTLIRLDATEPGHVDEAVARRLREEFGRHGIRSITEAARISGMRQQALNARMLGDIGFKLSEIDAICQATGASYDYVVSGIKVVDLAPPPRSVSPTPTRRERRRPTIQPTGWYAVA